MFRYLFSGAALRGYRCPPRKFRLFPFQQPAGLFLDEPARASRHISRCGSCKTACQSSGGADVLVVTAYAATGLDNPACHRRDSEISHDADDEEHDVHPVACLHREIRVSLHRLDVLLEHQYLDFRQYGAEQVRYRKPQVNLYVAAEPCRKRRVEAVPHGKGEDYRSQYGMLNQDSSNNYQP